MAYYDIDDILAEQERIHCVFNQQVPMYGFLDGNHQIDLNANVKVDLPFWLAEPLATAQVVDIDMPKCFNAKTIADLEANPQSVDLHMLCVYFYRFSKKMTDTIDDEPLEAIVLDALKKRIIDVYKCVVSKSKHDDTAFMRTLDETEKSMHRQGILAERELLKWMHGLANQLEPSSYLCLQKRIPL